MAETGALLKVEDLRVSFKTYGGRVQAVRDVSFHVDAGECVAVVGESGCGKSVTAKAILGLIESPQGSIDGGRVVFQGEDLTSYSEKRMQQVRGKSVSMIFQDPMTSLNPTMTIGKQISEVMMKHQKISKREAAAKTIEYLKLVGIANPEKRFREYPDSLSGGMRQRVVIAIAMCMNPRLLIADEPTTALDVTIQAQILELMQSLQKSFGTAIVLITHDLGVVANMAKRVLVFYAGKIVEEAPVRDIFYRPGHPYTHALLGSMPKLNSEVREQVSSIEGAPPDLFAPPEGCSFAARCPYAMELCKAQPPEIMLGDGHKAACWLNHPQLPAEKKPEWMRAGE
jgi:oligopeptide transport system ATP-binding protein